MGPQGRRGRKTTTGGTALAAQEVVVFMVSVFLRRKQVPRGAAICPRSQSWWVSGECEAALRCRTPRPTCLASVRDGSPVLELMLGPGWAQGRQEWAPTGAGKLGWSAQALGTGCAGSERSPCGGVETLDIWETGTEGNYGHWGRLVTWLYRG